MNSKRKGKVGELEACAALREHLGVTAHRAQQYCGSAGDADLQTSLAGVHFECKRTENLRLYEAVEQAESESGGKVPVVLHRRNKKPWLAIVPLDRLAELARRIERNGDA